MPAQNPVQLSHTPQLQFPACARIHKGAATCLMNDLFAIRTWPFLHLVIPWRSKGWLTRGRWPTWDWHHTTHPTHWWLRVPIEHSVVPLVACCAGWWWWWWWRRVAAAGHALHTLQRGVHTDMEEWLAVVACTVQAAHETPCRTLLVLSMKCKATVRCMPLGRSKCGQGAGTVVYPSCNLHSAHCNHM